MKSSISSTALTLFDEIPFSGPFFCSQLQINDGSTQNGLSEKLQEKKEDKIRLSRIESSFFVGFRFGRVAGSLTAHRSLEQSLNESENAFF